MNGKMKQFKIILFFASLLLAGLITLNGCKKSEPAALSEGDTEQVVIAAVEQTACPVMGAAIDKQFFTEYEGKKVYFCCPGCKAKFQAEPQKYLAKLPQFNQ
jgi:YHS domain-containing protein